MLNDKCVVVLIDFGMSVAFGSPIQGGSALYCPPESTTINVSSKTDVFAIGCILYEMLSGQQLFANPSKHCRWTGNYPMRKKGTGAMEKSSIPFPSNFDNRLKDIIFGALNPEHQERWDIYILINKLQQYQSLLQKEDVISKSSNVVN